MAAPILHLLARQMRHRGHQVCLRRPIHTTHLHFRPPCRAFARHLAQPVTSNGRPSAGTPRPESGTHACTKTMTMTMTMTRTSSTSSSTSNSISSTHSTPRQPRPPLAATLAAGVGLLSLLLITLDFPAPHSFLDAASASLSSYKERPWRLDRDGRDASFPRFRISEVRKHGAGSDQPWVMYSDKVYDITDWISAHPGGQVILRAAGGSLEPYWDIFAIHKAQYVRDILEQYLIGFVHADDLVDGMPARESIEDPFADDPARHPALITLTDRPRNAETPADALASAFLTPNDLFYVRNHMWVPRLSDDEAEAHVLTVELLDGSTTRYTLRDLKTRFPRRSVTAALQCSGNRRSDMSSDSGRTANGLAWSAGAISNATWEGVYLADVLADAGFRGESLAAALDGSSDEKHVHFAGLEAYAASIPIRKAVDPQGDVLLAYGMNGQPLPRDHGFPLRSVVPGNVAARSVKWLSHIALSDEESLSQWQRRDYKCFGPNQLTVDWDTAPSIQEMPVQSAMTLVKLSDWQWQGPRPPQPVPADADADDSGSKQDTSSPSRSSSCPSKRLSLSGYAISGGGREIIRVDVSTDGGKTWSQARLLPDCVSRDGSASPCRGHGAWAWKRWRFDTSLPAGAFTEMERKKGEAKTVMKDAKTQTETETETKTETKLLETESTRLDETPQGRRCTTLVVKATDEVYNTQPENQGSIWNVRGNLATAWHRVQVCTECAPKSTSGGRHLS